MMCVFPGCISEASKGDRCAVHTYRDGAPLGCSRCAGTGFMGKGVVCSKCGGVGILDHTKRGAPAKGRDRKAVKVDDRGLIRAASE